MASKKRKKKLDRLLAKRQASYDYVAERTTKKRHSDVRRSRDLSKLVSGEVLKSNKL